MTRLAAAALIAAVAAFSACGDGGAAGTAPASAEADRLSRGAALAATCSGCHAGPDEAFASINDLDAEALSAALKTYRGEIDGVSVMHRIARGYSDEDIEALSAYLGDTAADAR